MMVGNNLKDTQLQQIVDKTILFADKDEDGKISFEEFCAVSAVISLFSPYFLIVSLPLFCRWSETRMCTKKWSSTYKIWMSEPLFFSCDALRMFLCVCFFGDFFMCVISCPSCMG